LPNEINGSVTIDILDPLGKTVSSAKAPMDAGFLDQKMNVNHLPAGIYWIAVKAEGRIYRSMFNLIKE
jgi:hypothetical protein